MYTVHCTIWYNAQCTIHVTCYTDDSEYWGGDGGEDCAGPGEGVSGCGHALLLQDEGGGAAAAAAVPHHLHHLFHHCARHITINHSLFLSTLSRQLSPYTWQCTPHSVRVQQLYFSLYSLRWTFLHSDRKLLAVICVAVSMAQQWIVPKASVYKLSQKLLQLGWHYSVKFANVSHYCRHPFCHIGCKKC